MKKGELKMENFNQNNLRLNVSKEVIEGLLDGKKARKYTNWKLIYTVLKALGIAGSITALLTLGITPMFGVIVGSIAGTLDGIYTEVLKPAERAKNNEEAARIDFLLELQKNSNSLIRGRKLKLDKVGSINFRRLVSSSEYENLNAINENDENLQEFYGDGLEKDIVVVTDGLDNPKSDRKRVIATLAVVREYVLSTKNIVNGQGLQIEPKNSNNYVELLNDSTIEELPADIKKRTREVIVLPPKKNK